MRNAVAALLILACAVSQAQVWDKLIAPGLSYHMEVDAVTPRIVHVLRVSPGAPGLSIRAELADLKVYDSDEPKGREELSALIKRSGAIGGINADYFPFTGDPLGAMVRDGELVSRPYPKRAVFGWGKNWSGTGLLEWQGKIKPAGDEDLGLTGINEDCGDNALVLNTGTAGLALAKPPCVYAVLRAPDANWRPTGRNEATVELLYTDVASLPIQAGNIVLSARGKMAAKLAKLRPNQKVVIDMDTLGLDWTKADNVIGGGPFLVRNSKVNVDWQSAGFQDTFALKRHPRTAIGKSSTGDILLVAVDGRQEMSDGATLEEMAILMQRLGCDEAINLDGGGSTTIDLFGSILNRPSDGKERPISNAVLIFGPSTPPEPVEMAIQGPSRVQAGGNSVYYVVGPDGRAISNAEVIWTATGGAWVDQGGMLHGVKPGPAVLGAYSKGTRLSIPIAVEPSTGK